MISSKETLKRICTHFKAPIEYCFGYGSGVFSQGSKSEAKSRQIDMIFGVQSAKEWHEQNIAQNPRHYSGMRHFGSSIVAFAQNKLGAGIYFNPFVTLENQTVKYGVVELDTLHNDLTNWETLYLAGRMHKPVRIVQDHPKIQSAQHRNLRSAMSTALLLLPNEFSEAELYTKIAAVSYMGDVRMAFAENPRKVQNIVLNQFNHFRELYLPLFKEVDVGSTVDMSSILTSKTGPLSQGLPLFQQPSNEDRLLDFLPERFGSIVTKNRQNEVRRLRVSRAVAQIIKYPSFTQSMKGILTAGVDRSLRYSIAKLSKRFT